VIEGIMSRGITSRGFCPSPTSEAVKQSTVCRRHGVLIIIIIIIIPLFISFLFIVCVHEKLINYWSKIQVTR